ncbi:DUF1501 domain-containing protein [Rhizobium alvei]|uniref:DUF1501 domain-containing protein n=1 Tax=Rhizobium alvei TaxID=1132659 RepID=A0ABT8YHR0_9HYPH|nr:DUF1501 domain-containing protein [Rhizobium alvei]MDO6963223.1 DUF1501 domain-containing protein [Rhizobium alvei]
MAQFTISRRSFLASACCVAASPLITPVSFAATPGENRFITIVLRGALDGLYLVQPYTEPLLKSYRPELALDPSNGLIDLDGQFGLHPDAGDLLPLWKSGDLGFIHAVSTPYRNTRSHFDGQDILESGAEQAAEADSGWLNRALSGIANVESRKAIDVSASAELILSGPNPIDVWSSQSDIAMKPDEMAFFKRLYQSDPDFSKVFAEAVKTDDDADAVFGSDKRTGDAAGIAHLTAGMLRKDYRIANFSIGGWDTHVGQVSVFRRPLKTLVNVLTTLKTELGPEIWSKTAILAMTEFGRTVRQNGSRGTDHGTGGIAIIAGGAIRGGKVHGQWPGLKESALFENRDLMPTGDIRAISASLLHAQFDIGREKLTSQVFPGLEFDLAKQTYLKG